MTSENTIREEAVARLIIGWMEGMPSKAIDGLKERNAPLWQRATRTAAALASLETSGEGKPVAWQFESRNIPGKWYECSEYEAQLNLDQGFNVRALYPVALSSIPAGSDRP